MGRPAHSDGFPLGRGDVSDGIEYLYTTSLLSVEYHLGLHVRGGVDRVLPWVSPKRLLP